MINDVTEEIYEKLSTLIISPKEFQRAVSSTLVADPDSEGVIQRDILVDVVSLAIDFCLKRNFPCNVAQSLVALIADEFTQDITETTIALSAEDQIRSVRNSILSKVRFFLCIP